MVVITDESSSILVGEHQGHDLAGHGRVCWIGRVPVQVQVVGVDLEQDGVALDPREAKIMLAITKGANFATQRRTVSTEVSIRHGG